MKCSAHAFGTVLAFICIFLSTSCVTDYDTPETADGKMILNLRLDTSGMFTRSNDGSEVSNGMSATVDENYIDWEDVWIATFDATSGKRIDVLYSLGARNDGNDGNKVSASVDVSEYSGDVRIVALANWSRYGIVISDLNKITDIKDLNDLTFSFTPDNLKNTESKTEYCPLPMFGSETIATGFPLAKEKDVSISMTRALAKIEIVDNLDGDVRIESATLCNYSQSGKVVPSGGTEEGIGSSAEAVGNATDGSESTVESLGRDLPFNKIEGESGKSTFYVYVPEISLGEAGSDIRKIKLSLSGGKESEISLINYDENKQPSAEISDDWKSLERNHIYRFNVNALISTEPEIEIQPTIRVCWLQGQNGLYIANRIRLFKDNNDSDGLVGTNKGIAQTSSIYTFDEGITLDIFYEDIELTEDIEYDKLRYVIFYNDKNYYYNSNVYYPFVRKLSEDVLKLKNEKVNGKLITFCWLTSTPAYFSLPTSSRSYLPTNAKYRFYWRNIDDMSGLELFGYNSKNEKELQSIEYDIQAVKEDMNKGYYYIDFFIIKESIRYMSYRNNGINGFEYFDDFRGEIKLYDLFIEEIAGEEYYVFYAD